MNIVKKVINAKNNKEIAGIISKSIRKEINKSYRNNPNKNFIGANLDVNPQYHILKTNDIDKNHCEEFEINGSWIGFIPTEVKLTYAYDYLMIFTYNLIDTYCYDFGAYYYLNDLSYIYEFAKYLNANYDEYDEITTDDFLELVNTFLRNYFNNWFYHSKRAEIHQLIIANEKNKTYYKPIKEHSIHDFEKTGAAVCSELASAANNIFNVFNYKCIYLQDEGHSYNILMLPNKEKKNDYDYYLYDAACAVKYFYYNEERPKLTPYVTQIEDFNKNDLKKLLNGEIRITPNDYYSYEIGNTIYTIITEDERNYGVYNHSPKQEVKKLLLKK